MIFQTLEFPELVSRIFAERPQGTIDEWAGKTVFLKTQDAPEPGYYDPGRTPWTRRLQRLVQHPYHNGVRIRKFVAKKCSQSGFTEAVLNCIRWFAKFSPRNVIYSINSKEEVTNITDRLKETLKALGENIFTDNDDDMGKYKMKLLHMTLWFFGSYSAGSFANKQAPFTVADEVEEHAKLSGESLTTTNLASRGKRSEGMQVELSKPKMSGGPIDVDHAEGNCEIYLVACPHCGTYQELGNSSEEGGIPEGLIFRHCKDLLGSWDLEKVLRETYYQCQATYCGGKIYEHHKAQMVQEWPSVYNREKKTWEYVRDDQYIGMARWFATGATDKETGLKIKPDPEVISQHMSDLYSDVITFGQLAKLIITTKGDPTKRMGVMNHNFGLAWKQFASKTEPSHILGRRGAYKRGVIPFEPVKLLLGGDTGMEYARWVLGAIGREGELAIVDWGNELHPSAIGEIMDKGPLGSDRKPLGGWPLASDPGRRLLPDAGAIDAKYRKEDVYVVCLKSHERLWPCTGGGSSSSRQSLAFNRMERQDFPSWFGIISFNDRDFKSELYVDRIKKNEPAIMFPIDVDVLRPGETHSFVVELCGDRLVRDPRTGNLEWQRGSRPNHFGDGTKNIIVLWRYGTRDRETGEEDKPKEGS